MAQKVVNWRGDERLLRRLLQQTLNVKDYMLWAVTEGKADLLPGQLLEKKEIFVLCLNSGIPMTANEAGSAQNEVCGLRDVLLSLNLKNEMVWMTTVDSQDLLD